MSATRALALLALAAAAPGQIIELAPAADATADADRPGTSFGANAELWFGKQYQSSPTFRVWFARGHARFDLAPVAGLGLPSRATFRWYQSRSGAAGCLPVTLHRVTAAWSESTLTWNTKPPHDPTPVATVCVGDSFDLGWKAFDVTPLVAGWLTGSYANHGLVVRDPSETTAGAARPGIGHSRESAAADRRPFLELEYLPAIGQGCGAPAARLSLAGSGPRPGATMTVRVRDTVAGASVNLVFGVSTTRWGPILLPHGLAYLGAPTCALLVSPDVLFTAGTAAGTMFDFPIPLPAATPVGLTVYAQALGLGGGALHATQGSPLRTY